ncbi:MAG: hypothetical protein KC619_12530 [Myxococcales bacterium]|nr:hypothetical protein [Myxococcales bacterium]
MTFEALLAALRRGATVRARWEVRPPAVPGGVGPGRLVRITRDGSPVDGEALERLRDAIVGALGLPVAHEAMLQAGQGLVAIDGARLVLELEETIGIPYGPTTWRDGTVTLVEL